ncbi:MAG: TIGR02302 family protein [Hyphomicrobium sp.]
MTDLDPNAAAPAIQRAFARKVRLSKWALFFERLWPRLWLLIGLAALFTALSLSGVWPLVSPLTHQAILAAFAAAAVAALIYAARAPWPTRDEAVRRIERRSGIAHRPASSYEDQLSGQTSNPETAALWQAHRERLKRAIERLKVGRPSPRADRFDPLAVRALAVLLLVPAALLVTGSFSDRIASAFRFGGLDDRAGTRVDAWVTPPPYTAVPPVLLSDGSATAAKPEDAGKMFEVPERSLLTLRGTGFGASGVSLEILSDGATAPDVIASDPPKAGDTTGLAEIRHELKKSARIRALSGSTELARWTFSVIPDQLPKIALDNKALDRTPRGSMKLSYKAEDDYGVASAAAKVRQIAPKKGDPTKAWAQAAPLKGPRLPLERPPILTLKIPRAGAKVVEGSTLLELGSHPWAGQRVELWLEATDVGGQIGKSTPVEMILPARRFKKPLARAVIEQRRKLSEDSRNRPAVARALAALTMEPEGFIETTGIYLGLRSVYHRLEREYSRAVLKESIEQLWQLALSIEDGKLSDAERALKEAQDKLSEALQKGADEQELDKLIAELKQKLNDYLQEMQKNAEKDNQDGDQNQQGDDQQQQELGQQDLDQMMKDLEKNAKEGSREEAEKMLSELRELMDRMQAETKESRAENQRAKEMMKKLGQLDDLAGQQQELMDDTFADQKPGQEGSDLESKKNSMDKGGKQQRNGKSGQQGQQRGEQQDDGPPSGQEPGGDQQAEGEPGQGKSGKNARQPGEPGSLKDRQAQLRKKLDQLQKELDEMGAGDPDKLGKADEAMGKAEESLEQGDNEEAAEQQGEALEQMRQSAKQMAEQMQKNAQQKMGRGGDTPRDPLGRPQKAEGPDLGTSVKVPNAIDAQRAREILEELRKRSGESLRPPSELDYIDRLLKRF